MYKTNPLFNPDSETFGGYGANCEECIYAMRLMNRVIDGAKFAIGATPNDLLDFEPSKTKWTNPYLVIAEHVRRISKEYAKRGYDGEEGYPASYDAFIRDLEEIAYVDYSGMFGFPKLDYTVKGRIVNRIHYSDMNNILLELSDALEWSRGTIFSDVINWGYVLDLMEASAE